jgi:hypothetical protein
MMTETGWWRPDSRCCGPATLEDGAPYPLTSPTDVVFSDSLKPPQPCTLPPTWQLPAKVTFASLVTFAKPA